MNRGHNTIKAMGPYVAKEGLHDDLLVTGANGDWDEDDLAVFGERPQLRVSVLSPSRWILALMSHNSENSASFPWSV